MKERMNPYYIKITGIWETLMFSKEHTNLYLEA